MSSYDPFLDHDESVKPTQVETKKRKNEESQDIKNRKRRTLLLKTIFNQDDDDDDHGASLSIVKNEKTNASMGEERVTEERRAVITKTALFLSQNPDKASHLMEKSKGAKNMTFLFDPLCTEGKFYQSELLRLRAEKDIKDAFAEKVAATTTATTNATLSVQLHSRSVFSFQLPVNGIEIKHSDERYRDQRELQLIESRIREAFNANAMNSCSDNMVGEEQLYEERLREYKELAARYDEHEKRDTICDAEANGGIIDGGTWEHRKRANEMLDTAAKNLALTVSSAGRHHLGDFLPKSELGRFMTRVESTSSASSSNQTTVQLEGDRLSSSNVGFQMLQKVGWSEGSGLGARPGSIIEPLSAVGQLSRESRGLGLDTVNEPRNGDDEFEQYRKRMQLAYRFRPNPLNNPRRPY